MRKVAILCDGNGGRGMAADLTLAGFQVHLWVGPGDDHEAVLREGRIRLRGVLGAMDGEAKLSLVTLGDEQGLKECIKDVELVIVVAPAFAHKSLAEFCAPHFEQGQVIALIPGGFGSFEFAQVVNDKRGTKGLVFAETPRLPYSCRKISPTGVAIDRNRIRLPAGVFPAKHTNKVIEMLREFFLAIIPATNVLDAALNNTNPVGHPVATLMNTGAIEALEHWNIYTQGMTHSVLNVAYAVDAERLALREAFGFPPPHFRREPQTVKYMQDFWGELIRLADAAPWLLKEPSGLQHRFIAEDVPYGLVFFSSLGELVDVPTPVSKSLIQLASVANKINYETEGRNIRNLGLAGLSTSELHELLEEGWD